MIWDQLKGHQDVILRFRRSLERGRLSHALLLTGPDGVGKRLFARLLAQCLFCERHADAELLACGECPTCKLAAAATHPDQLLIECPPGKREIPIELFVGSRQKRGKEGLCHDLNLKPMAGNRKVAIINDGQLLNDASANALLKTLEEPPPNSLLIVITNQADRVLPTIQSRCQTVRFSSLSEDAVSGLLIQLGWVDDKQAAKTIAVAAEGSMHRAEQLLDETVRNLREQLYVLLAQNKFNGVETAEAAIAAIDDHGGDSAEQRTFATWIVHECTEFYRQSFHSLTGNLDQLYSPQIEQFTQQFQQNSNQGFEILAEMMDRTIQAEEELGRNTTIPLCFESFFHDLEQIQRLATIP